MMDWRRIIRAAKGYAKTVSWRLRGVGIADRIVVEGKSPSLSNAGRIIIGSRLLFRTKTGRTRIGTGPAGTLSIGGRGFINGGTAIYANDTVTIGDHCLIGENVRIDDCAYHQVEQDAPITASPITIGRNVWIANDSTIFPGVSLGDHCVVGAGSVVTKSFPARSLVAGNPARLIRELSAGDDFIRQ